MEKKEIIKLYFLKQKFLNMSDSLANKSSSLFLSKQNEQSSIQSAGYSSDSTKREGNSSIAGKIKFINI